MGIKFDNTVLIVDDEEFIRTICKNRISEFVSDVFACADGDEALALMSTRHIDLIFLDIIMPNMDGITLLKNVRKMFPETLCVFVSAYGDRENIKDALQLGAYDFLEKPIDFDILDNCVTRCLEKINYEKIQKEILELLLYHYSDQDPRKFNELPPNEKGKTLAGVLGTMKIKLLNKSFSPSKKL